MVISELVKYVREQLDDNAEFEARQLVMHIMGINHTELILKSRAEVSEEITSEIMRCVKRRKNGEPLQYIIGTAEFMSLEFKVTPDTLIPRSDTETLVETVIDCIGERKVTLLDIGSGTGCIGISVAHYTNADVTFVDVSRSALSIAEENAKKHNINAEFINMDILQQIPIGKYDIIVSNPPYIETEVIETLQREVKDYEPVLALDGGADGLKFYRRIAEIAPSLLNANGILAFEIGYNQGKAVFEILQKNFENVKLINDLCGNDRVVIGSLKMN
ncbi:MAG: peptide chain release factor N(5)-glutamine methyltransferase [Clostridia bacterium]